MVLIIDTISDLFAVAGQNEVPNYNFSSTGISWSSDSGKYGKYGYTNLSMIYPPVNWRPQYPPGPYTADFPPPDIATDEHFQVWMRTAGWPTFLKAYGRNDQTILKAGEYTMTIDMSKFFFFLK